MIVGGYKLKGYDATYEKTTFDVRQGVNAENNCVLEVTDISSGITYIFEHGQKKHPEKRRNKGKSRYKK